MTNLLILQVKKGIMEKSQKTIAYNQYIVTLS